MRRSADAVLLMKRFHRIFPHSEKVTQGHGYSADLHIQMNSGLCVKNTAFRAERLLSETDGYSSSEEQKYSERKNIFSFTGADMHGVTAGNGCARQY